MWLMTDYRQKETLNDLNRLDRLPIHTIYLFVSNRRWFKYVKYPILHNFISLRINHFDLSIC